MLSTPGQAGHRDQHDALKRAAGGSEIDALGMEPRIPAAGWPKHLGCACPSFAFTQLCDHRMRPGEQSRRDAQAESAPAKKRGSFFRGLRNHMKRRAERERIAFAHRREQEAARQAAKKLDAERLLQSPDLLADRPRSYRKLVCRVLEAQMARCGLEGAQSVQRRKAIAHEPPSREQTVAMFMK
jgi:hypothetical protein